MAFITYWLTVKFDSRNSLLSLINNFLSQRLRFGQEGLRRYPPRLFGTHIQWDTSINSYFLCRFRRILTCSLVMG